MSCIDITPLVLSDTFNTWFERTNEMISELNSFEIRGLSAASSGGVKAIKITDIGSCLLNISLETGPFVGFETSGVDAGIYGTGSHSSPYKLTLKYSGGESAFSISDPVTGDDYLLVSDTSNNNLFKKARVDEFRTNSLGGLTDVSLSGASSGDILIYGNYNSAAEKWENKKLKAGKNISITRDGTGNFVVAYSESTFSPTFTVSGISDSTVYEIGTTVINSSSFNFTVARGSGNVNPAAAMITTTESNEVSGFSTINITSFPSGTNTVSSGTITLPINTHWFNVNDTEIRFSASITSDDENTDGAAVEVENTTKTVAINFGWRWVLFTTTASLTAGSTYTSYLDAGVTYGPFEDPTAQGSTTLVWPSGAGYAYFAHSSSSTGGTGALGDSYGWTPKFYLEGGTIREDGFTEVTSTPPTTYNGKYYRIWRSPNISTNNRFVVKENGH